MPTRILLADDSRAFIAEVRAHLEREGFEVVGTANDGREALDKAMSLNPEVVVLDHAMPRMSGLEAARAIHNACPGVRLVFLTRHGAEHLIIAAFRAGTRGFVAKRDAADLPRAILEVSRGGVFLSPDACGAVMQPYFDAAPDSIPIPE
jgi:DNA-binding NarL/FixJ family response regulator